MKRFSPTKPVYFISTHLDDVVLSCAHFLAANPGCTVITVLAGAPEQVHEGYNSNTTGERYAPDAVQKRRSEDRAALELLSATPVHLGLYDNDYIRQDRRSDLPDIVEAVRRAISNGTPGSIISPLGSEHSDHIGVSEACIQLARESDLDWYLYADMPYMQRNSELFNQRLAEIQREVTLEAFDPFAPLGELKHEAFKLYKSQYEPTIGSWQDFPSVMATPELYWRIVRRS